MGDYINKVKTLISLKTGVEFDELSEEAYFEEDLNIPELEFIEILSDIEEMFEIDEIVENKSEITTVGELLERVADKVE